MHGFPYAAVAQMLQLVPVPRRVLALTTSGLGEHLRPLFAGADYTALDVVPLPGVDIVADVVSVLPAPAPDCVVCCDVLEHTLDAAQMVSELVDIVAPGGSVLLTCGTGHRPPHSALDGGPLQDGEFYQNVPQADLLRWCKAAKLRVVDVLNRADVGDLYVCGVRA